MPSPLSEREFGRSRSVSKYPAGKVVREIGGSWRSRDIHESRTEDAGYRRDPERNTSPL